MFESILPTFINYDRKKFSHNIFLTEEEDEDEWDRKVQKELVSIL
jgi:hypothetical protein